MHWIKWAKNDDIWPKMSVLGQIWLFLGQKSIFLGGEGQTYENKHLKHLKLALEVKLIGNRNFAI